MTTVTICPAPYILKSGCCPGDQCVACWHLILSVICDLSCCCLVAQSCSALCDPMDCSPPGSSVCGILQARILDWVVICFRGSSHLGNWICVSCIGEWILFSFYHWVTWEACDLSRVISFLNSQLCWGTGFIFLQSLTPNVPHLSFVLTPWGHLRQKKELLDQCQ